MLRFADFSSNMIMFFEHLVYPVILSEFFQMAKILQKNELRICYELIKSR